MIKKWLMNVKKIKIIWKSKTLVMCLVGVLGLIPRVMFNDFGKNVFKKSTNDMLKIRFFIRKIILLLWQTNYLVVYF